MSDDWKRLIMSQGEQAAVVTVGTRVPSAHRHNRPMHQTTFTLGDQAINTYSTTQAESYSGMDAQGKPLIFFYRDAPYPSQHYGNLDITSNTGAIQTQTHSRHVYTPKTITEHHVLHSHQARNRTRNCEGETMKEVTNPPETTPYITTYCSEHSVPKGGSDSTPPTGKPTLWHRHDILTGQDRGPVNQGRGRRASRDKVLWADRRWETDSGSLRLY
ncbi:uncharacterized protein LOC114794128 [Denticeps clupeoides]|uniref:uncharacterized protein LOC114794128 n=1 Tax=Denticeps clupeoides TaxID=299321 RepID=UPI0010A4479D|nr:uncharacterized protein LOC114794128 [Denticeps clupeoides]